MIERMKSWALCAIFSAVAVLIALLKGRRYGREQEHQEQQAGAAQAAAKASKEIRNVRTEVDGKTAGAADKQLRDEWMRNE